MMKPILERYWCGGFVGLPLILLRRQLLQVMMLICSLLHLSPSAFQAIGSRARLDSDGAYDGIPILSQRLQWLSSIENTDYIVIGSPNLQWSDCSGVVALLRSDSGRTARLIRPEAGEVWFGVDFVELAGTGDRRGELVVLYNRPLSEGGESTWCIAFYEIGSFRRLRELSLAKPLGTGSGVIAPRLEAYPDFDSDGLEDLILYCSSVDQKARVLVLSSARGDVLGEVSVGGQGYRSAESVLLGPDLDGDGFREVISGNPSIDGDKGGLVQVHSIAKESVHSSVIVESAGPHFGTLLERCEGNRILVSNRSNFYSTRLVASEVQGSDLYIVDLRSDQQSVIPIRLPPDPLLPLDAHVYSQRGYPTISQLSARISGSSKDADMSILWSNAAAVGGARIFSSTLDSDEVTWAFLDHPPNRDGIPNDYFIGSVFATGMKAMDPAMPLVCSSSGDLQGVRLNPRIVSFDSISGDVLWSTGLLELLAGVLGPPPSTELAK